MKNKVSKITKSDKMDRTNDQVKKRLEELENKRDELNDKIKKLKNMKLLGHK